ncbi:MAG: exodeoxyribonuclease VII small subunit [Chloroflexota bacterium]|nr:exodeoxyribonuclease VII small subunit [Chloroflexota bacterium]MDE2908198.1 exodeoxyribonuclease VII small subunit [Chloroflexota bacterium]
MMKDIANLSYEEAYEALEALVARMESGALPLEQTVALYERGQKLAAHCQALLEDAELKIKLLDEAGSAD